MGSRASSRILPALLVLSVLIIEGALGGRALGAVVQQIVQAQTTAIGHLAR
jgi:hypothetical protein